jgi:hypothetical protein
MTKAKAEKKLLTNGPKTTEAELEKEKLRQMRERVDKCRAEVDALCKKYNCILGAQPVITRDGRIGADPILIPQ